MRTRIILIALVSVALIVGAAFCAGWTWDDSHFAGSSVEAI